jgi:hypothetical protein
MMLVVPSGVFRPASTNPPTTIVAGPYFSKSSTLTGSGLHQNIEAVPRSGGVQGLFSPPSIAGGEMMARAKKRMAVLVITSFLWFVGFALALGEPKSSGYLIRSRDLFLGAAKRSSTLAVPRRAKRQNIVPGQGAFQGGRNLHPHPGPAPAASVPTLYPPRRPPTCHLWHDMAAT